MLSLAKEATFTEFKQKFYSRFPDPAVFDCMDFNLLKVVLDGLKVNYASKNITDLFIFKPLWLQSLLLLRGGMQNRNAKVERTKAGFLFFDNGRSSVNSNGVEVSYYFDRIEHYFGADKCYTVFQKRANYKKNAPAYAQLVAAFGSQQYSAGDKALLKELRRKAEELITTFKLDAVDALNIKTAFTNFFRQYCIFNRYFKQQSFQKCFFDQHYHREGLMLALKKNKILSVELQHGLILAQDIFYIFPSCVVPVRNKALFPDKMLCYGNYWVNTLKTGFEFAPSKLEIIGLYQTLSTSLAPHEQAELSSFLNNESYILITTQTFLHDAYVRYASWLSEDLLSRHSPVKIIVKKHPSENAAHYQSLNERPNCRVLDLNTEYLLKHCMVHVSIYSTTLFDALKYNRPNYALLHSASIDYVQKIVDDGIAKPLEFNMNPLDFPGDGKGGVTPSDFYADFDMYKHNLLN